MDNLLALLLGALQITLLDLMLAGDNVGVIALATRNLPAQYAKKASAIGVAAAIILRIFFASVIGFVLMIEWLPLRLAGGLVLVWITWDFIRPGKQEEELHVRTTERFWGAVASIILADITMSLDNVLAIGSASKGNTGLIVFGLLLNIPILFFASQFVAELMRKHLMVIYIGGAVLAHTAVSMIFEDPLLQPRIPEFAETVLPWLAALATLAFGWWLIRTGRIAPEIPVSAESVRDEESIKSE